MGPLSTLLGIVFLAWLFDQPQIYSSSKLQSNDLTGCSNADENLHRLCDFWEIISFLSNVIDICISYRLYNLILRASYLCFKHATCSCGEQHIWFERDSCLIVGLRHGTDVNMCDISQSIQQMWQKPIQWQQINFSVTIKATCSKGYM